MSLDFKSSLIYHEPTIFVAIAIRIESQRYFKSLETIVEFPADNIKISSMSKFYFVNGVLTCGAVK
jgi:hypothetical protein